MIKDIFILVGICLVVIPTISAILYLFSGKNLTTKLWNQLSPGIGILINIIYIWTQLGGIHNLSAMAIVYP